MKNIAKYVFISISVIVVVIALIFSITNKSSQTKELYRVYLDGKSIGLIESKEELDEYIDKEQNNIKQKYNVNKIYAPTGLQVQKEITYDKKVMSTKDIYENIKEKSNFTIEAYEITIKKDKPIVFYVLNKEDFEKAVDKTVKSFVTEEEYNMFKNKTQPEIKDFGTLIEDIYIDQEIVIKKKLVPADENIYTSEEEITKFLLYGEKTDTKIYTVQEADNIEKVAFNNGLNSHEFLIANPQFTDSNNLLFPGQEVVVDLINPQFDVVVEMHSVQKKTKEFKTEVIYEPNMYLGDEEVRREGEVGENKVTEKLRYVNGQINTVVLASSEELKPAVNKIVAIGQKYVKSVGSGYWAWPSLQPYTISTYYGYRWGSMHAAIDITGVGHGSPVYAANNGVVYDLKTSGSTGNAIYINHNNGYYTVYMHLSKILVKKGQVVEKGQVIGLVGNTGQSTGTHLHFGVNVGAPFYRGGHTIDPFTLYNK